MQPMAAIWGMGGTWGNGSHMGGTYGVPEGTMADLSGRLRLPSVGLGAARPPQTLGDPGAVKPNTCPCTCTHAYTAMSTHSPDRGH